MPVHLSPRPEKPSTIAGFTSIINFGGFGATCKEIKGNATWETTTTGTIDLSIIGCGFGPFGTCAPAEAKGLPFHLLTLPVDKPGILITPPAGGLYFKIVCTNVTFEVQGNGLIGTITAPNCGTESSTVTIKFSRTGSGVQQHLEVEGTETDYQMALVPGGSPVALEAETAFGFEGKTQLICT